MGVPKISNIILGFLALGGIFALLSGLLVHSAARTGNEFDEESIQIYNRMEEMTQLAEDVHSSEKSLSSNSIIDILGDLFKQASLTVRISRSLIDDVDEMSDSSVKDMNLGYSGKTLRILLAVSFLIILVFIFIAVMLKWSV